MQICLSRTVAYSSNFSKHVVEYKQTYDYVFAQCYFY